MAAAHISDIKLTRVIIEGAIRKMGSYDDSVKDETRGEWRDWRVISWFIRNNFALTKLGAVQNTIAVGIKVY